MTTSDVVKKAAQLVEIKPGEIWEANGGVHEGLRVEVIRDTGSAVKVRVIRNSGASGGYKMVGQRWSPPRTVFLARYRRVDPEVVDKPKVETDLGVLLQKMPPPPVVQEAVASVKLDDSPNHAESEMTQEAIAATEAIIQAVTAPKSNVVPQFLTDQAKINRMKTLDARVAALAPEQLEVIKSRRLAGESVPKLAHDYKLDVFHMAGVLDGLGLSKRKPNPPTESVTVYEEQKRTLGEVARDTINGTIEHQLEHLTDEQKKKIVTEYQAGAEYKPLLARHGLISGVLAKVLDEAGVERRLPPSRVPRVKKERGRVVPRELIGLSKPVEESKTTNNFKAVVVVMVPSEKMVGLNADSFDDALAQAKALDGVVRVKSISEF